MISLVLQKIHVVAPAVAAADVAVGRKSAVRLRDLDPAGSTRTARSRGVPTATVHRTAAR